ncbi:hypothetical protein AX774_g2693 [Zancudomyces culisetae]|uniref:Uncharacterized protein n=1 Tax=Zancudomyces culisetae TaxID=1213189 RepID=A0A1R1PS33_ZANCU|nr:hypothetical protein AX774_g2931 [Zancudomyces culisetae]OMH83796.1 hypothetical protein AX774_g2693 [Zancudomyces culisetae]|eukprot:OMH83561.1 hypothetical protein AX774_g2931 [Zancudomyces culisetae]
MYHTSGSKQSRYSEDQYFSAPSDESSSQDSDSPHLSSVSPLSVRSMEFWDFGCVLSRTPEHATGWFK